jgi:hypothetical protein
VTKVSEEKVEGPISSDTFGLGKSRQAAGIAVTARMSESVTPTTFQLIWIESIARRSAI